jgi:hypothetical protein
MLNILADDSRAVAVISAIRSGDLEDLNVCWATIPVWRRRGSLAPKGRRARACTSRPTGLATSLMSRRQ